MSARRVAWRFADAPRDRPLLQVAGPGVAPAHEAVEPGVYIGTVAEVGDYARQLVARNQARP